MPNGKPSDRLYKARVETASRRFKFTRQDLEKMKTASCSPVNVQKVTGAGTNSTRDTRGHTGTHGHAHVGACVWLWVYRYVRRNTNRGKTESSTFVKVCKSLICFCKPTQLRKVPRRNSAMATTSTRKSTRPNSARDTRNSHTLSVVPSTTTSTMNPGTNPTKPHCLH